ncbi:MAG: hypothetical protein GY746_01545, partial [Gammaproteobacteria bacterium]|nr:hypothetical protein [Gammaproteobacteria bacterium]
DGLFNDATLENAIYTPGPVDITNGSVTLTITVNGNAPCGNTSDDMILTIVSLPVVDAGADATICEDASHTLAGIVSNYSSVVWSTTGDGSFDNTSILGATYTPGTNDIANDSVMLILTGNPNAPCVATDADSVWIFIQLLPLANAGADVTICEDGTYTLSGIASNETSTLWTTSGDGSFNDASNPGATYTPGANDIFNGTVTLTLTATATLPCGADASDDILITLQALPTADAGFDATICEDDTYTLPGNASAYSSLSWSSGGTGTFDNNTILTPIYTPSPADIAAGSVILTLQANGINPCGASIAHNMTLSFQLLPVTSAGSDATICEGATHPLNGSSSTNSSSLLWTTTGDGVFSNATIIDPVYIPGVNDIATTSADLTLTAQALAPCSAPSSHTITLTIQPLPITNAGVDTTICEGDSYSLNGIALYQSSVLWTTTGDGVFSSTTILKPVYTPGPGDIANGFVTLTLTSTGTLPCTSTSSDDVVITIQLLPTADAGADATICEDASYTLPGTASNYSTSLWTTTGDGTFDNDAILVATYTPGPNDIINGSVLVTLTAQAIGPCRTPAIDEIEIFIQLLPLSDAGLDDTICEDGTYILNGIVTNQSSVLWTTGGDGVFDDASLPGAEYTPGTNDIANGSVVLTLTANATGPCTTAAVSTMTLYIQLLPLASAGPDATICENDSYTINGVATNYSSTVWSTAGDGSFDDISIPGATYTPGPTDRTNGSVVLTLTANATPPCATAADTFMTLTLIPLPVADAGADDAICEYETYTLAGIATNQSSLLWTTSGDGAFSDATILTPVYTPGAADIAAGSVTLSLTALGLIPCGDSTESMILTINPMPTPVITGDTAVCEFEAGVIYSTPDVIGNTYEWLIKNGAITTGQNTNQIIVTWDIAGTGNLNVIETVGATGCVDTTVTFSVTINPLPIADAGPDQSINNGTNTQLDGSASGAGNYSYSWTPASMVDDANLEDPNTVSLFTTTTYVLVVTDTVTGCVSVGDTVIITVEGGPLSVNPQASPDTICDGDVTNLIANAGGGSGSFTFSWTSNPAGFTSSISNPTDNPSVSTWYIITVDDGFNTYTDSVLVTVNPLPTADAGADVSICLNDCTNLTASGATDYVWNDGATTASINVCPVSTTTYSVTATDVNGCTDSDEVIVTVWPLPTADAGLDASICLNDCTDLTASGGVGYLWNTGDATATINVCPITTTTYTITVTDANGCTDSDEVIITVWPLPTADAGSDVSICLNYCTDLTASGAVGYLWNTGDATATINVCPTTTTTYTVTVTDGNGCSDSDEVIVTVWPLPTADAGSDVSICLNYCTDLTASGAAGYLWSNGGNTSTINVCPTTTTTYTVTVTDGNGCSDSDEVIVTVWPLPTADAGTDVSICLNYCTDLTASGAA